MPIIAQKGKPLKEIQKGVKTEKLEELEKERFIKKLLGVFTQEQAELLWKLFQTKADKNHKHPVWRA